MEACFYDTDEAKFPLCGLYRDEPFRRADQPLSDPDALRHFRVHRRQADRRIAAVTIPPIRKEPRSAASRHDLHHGRHHYGQHGRRQGEGGAQCLSGRSERQGQLPQNHELQLHHAGVGQGGQPGFHRSLGVHQLRQCGQGLHVRQVPAATVRRTSTSRPSIFRSCVRRGAAEFRRGEDRALGPGGRGRGRPHLYGDQRGPQPRRHADVSSDGSATWRRCASWCAASARWNWLSRGFT